jgi:hypothetical protein
MYPLRSRPKCRDDTSEQHGLDKKPEKTDVLATVPRENLAQK